MLVSLTLPDLKFQIGDIIMRKNQYNPHAVFLLIASIQFTGYWLVDVDNERHYGYSSHIQVEQAEYGCHIQPGSFYDTLADEPMPPSFIDRFIVLRAGVLEQGTLSSHNETLAAYYRSPSYRTAAFQMQDTTAITNRLREETSYGVRDTDHYHCP